MFKLIKKYLDIELINVSLVFAIVFFLFFNSAVVIDKFDYSQETHFKTILELSKDFIYIYLYTFIIFFGLTTHRVAFALGSVFLFVTGAIASYFLYFLQITPTQEVVGNVISASFSEVYAAFTVKLIIWLIFSLLTCMYMLKHFAIKNSKFFATRLLSAVCLLIAVNNIITPQFIVLKDYFPIQYLHNSYLYFTENSIK